MKNQTKIYFKTSISKLQKNRCIEHFLNVKKKVYVNNVHVFSSFDEYCKEIQAYTSCKQGAELSMCENDHEKTECT